MILCSVLILFFSWLLMHAFVHSKFNRIIEGLDPAATTTGPTAGPTAGPTTDENTAQIQNQIVALINTATQLTATMNQNEAGIKNNTALIQKVIQSQNDTNAKLASMKKAQ
jgi:ABC-type transporter Mla subunit MlaD